jgi:hypothetical protein
MFGLEVLKPEIGREPTYDNVYNTKGRSQSFFCAYCNSHVGLDIVDCVGKNAQDPKTVLGPGQGDLVREHFGILSKSLANSWPRMSIASCAACGQGHLIYVAMFEPKNGWQEFCSARHHPATAF